MELGLNNSVAVVVGGASGIGKAAAEGLLAEGAQVSIWDAHPDTTAIADNLPNCHGQKVDITSLPEIQSAVTEVLKLSGKIDHLVHSAAVGSGKFGAPFTRLDSTDWARVLDVNVTGMVNIAHEVAPIMCQQDAGTMVFVASVAGQIGSPTDPPYSASKAANINFAQVMARDLAIHNIRVNTVCPGMVKTSLNRSVWKSWNERQATEHQLSYDNWAESKIQELVPMGRWQKATDIADMIVFLSSKRASEVTGQTINVDGGYVMHW